MHLFWYIIFQYISRYSTFKQFYYVLFILIFFIPTLFSFLFWYFCSNHFGQHYAWLSSRGRYLLLFILFKIISLKKCWILEMVLLFDYWFFLRRLFYRINRLTVVKRKFWYDYFTHSSLKVSILKSHTLWFNNFNVIKNKFILTRIWIFWNRCFQVRTV